MNALNAQRTLRASPSWPLRASPAGQRAAKPAIGVPIVPIKTHSALHLAYILLESCGILHIGGGFRLLQDAICVSGGTSLIAFPCNRYAGH